jgi:hypothetical protein
MSIEERLRAAIGDRTNHVEPSTDGLHRIEERLMDSTRHDSRNRWLMGVGAAAAVVALLVAAVLLGGDENPEVETAGSTTSSSSTTSGATSTTSDTTTTTAGFTGVDVGQPIWPRAATSQRFDDPVSAARSFVVDLVGMADPVLGQFQQGDPRSGEVPVRPAANGPVSTVLVRMLEDDTWFVIGSTTADIRLDEPTAGSDIDCPLRLTGEALAFEGHVDVAIWDDLGDAPIATGFVTGGGGPAAPFDGTVDCDLGVLDDGVHFGTVILTTEGGEAGGVWQIVATRVALK